MHNVVSKWTIAIALLIAAHTIYASEAVTKTYRFSNVKHFVSNRSSCNSFYSELKKLSTKSIALQFTPTSGANFHVKEMSGSLVNFTYQIVAQDKKDNMISRIGMGSFEINHAKVDYMIEIAGDVKQKNFKYFYPVVLSSSDAHCYYSALLKPGNETVVAFKKHIQSSSVAKQTNLVTQQ
ncbi:MAG: hypothetical protein A3E84_04910 [Gammaproteobacteria bacterium RIFCSPHIGHO2_12_FULL_42_13]|nr:MAG: hypothetical protein A3E84_04910 [Gammaproteobacteria bacterium RIFCSPHIGHO2_12_FULL_42_13]